MRHLPEVAQILRDCTIQGIGTRALTKGSLGRISDTESPQGIAAVVSRRFRDMDKVLTKQGAIVIILDGVSDPGNAGTIIRTAEASGASAVFLLRDCVEAINPKTVRAASGSLFRFPVFDGISFQELRSKLQHKRFMVIGAQKDGCWLPERLKTVLGKRIALVLGSETHGLSRTVVEKLDETVKIPMEGKVESLNVAVTAAVLLYWMKLHKKA